MKTRKDGAGTSTGYPFVLQWGRVDEDAEGVRRRRDRRRPACFNGAASMKTRKDRGPGRGHRRLPGFNGAASMKTRKGGGKTRAEWMATLLQWGRVDEDAEG